MPKGEALCRLDGVVKGYGPNTPAALGPISLEVHTGEILGVRGPNGAGKSTLMGVLAGVLRPDSGAVEYGQGVRESIGYVPQ